MVEEPEEEIQVDIGGGGADVDTAVVFPGHENGEFPANSVITAVVGFKNAGKKHYVVNGIEGSFRAPQDYRYHLFNFSGVAVNQAVAPGDEIGIIYKVK